MLYVEGGTDVEILKALARKAGHPAAEVWDGRINSFYVQDNSPGGGLDTELARVEGGFGLTPRQHFFALRSMAPALRGLALLDSDGRERTDSDDEGLRISYWRRYECENYIVTPETLRGFARDRYGDAPLLLEALGDEIDEVLDALILERVFEGRQGDFDVWKASDPAARRLLWLARTERLKLSTFAEDFFRRLAARLGHAMLLRKGELHRLVDFLPADEIAEEVSVKLDLLRDLFAAARPEEET